MARPRRDGRPSTTPDKRKLSKTIIKALKPRGSPYTVWDTTTRGLVIRVHSRRMTWKVVYSRHGRPRWYHIGDVSTIKLPECCAEAAMFTFVHFLPEPNPHFRLMYGGGSSSRVGTHGDRQRLFHPSGDDSS
jgi:hypothetical protein